MKNAFWGYWLILLGVFIVVIMLLVQNLTSSSTQDYYLIKELTEAAMIDAVDYTYYRNFGEIRINKEKFYETFLRRFSETASLSTTYTVSFYGVYEAPPKASVEIKSKSASFNIVGDSTSFDMVERINAIIEGNPVSGGSSSTGSNNGGNGIDNNKVSGMSNKNNVSKIPSTLNNLTNNVETKTSSGSVKFTGNENNSSSALSESKGNGVTTGNESANLDKVSALSAKDGEYIKPLEPFQATSSSYYQTTNPGSWQSNVSTDFYEDPYAQWVFPIGSTFPTDPINNIYLGPVPDGYRISSPVTLNRCISGKKCADHIAIDIAGNAGANVISASTGVVTFVYNKCEQDDNKCKKSNSKTARCQCGQERGNQVYVLNDNGVLAIYQHLLHDSIQVVVGQRVRQGQLLASLGSSGYSTGSHLHFEVHENPAQPGNMHDLGGIKVNPELYVDINNPRP